MYLNREDEYKGEIFLWFMAGIGVGVCVGIWIAYLVIK